MFLIDFRVVLNYLRKNVKNTYSFRNLNFDA